MSGRVSVVRLPWAWSLYVLVRHERPGKRALGFVVKWQRRPRWLMFSEREGLYAHSFSIGRLYARTFKRKAI